jgi:hypothetical protein
MATYSSKHEKNQELVDPIFVLASVALIVVLVVFGPLNSYEYRSVRNAPNNLSPSVVVSFAADEQYWDAHCSHGWGSDFTCENIVSRTQACYSGLAGFASAYCTEYNAYMKQFQHRPLAGAS